MSLNGVIAISRKLFDPDDAFFGGEPFTRREAWQWLIAMAAWKPKRVRVHTGRGETYLDLERGQLSYSRAYLCEAWGWSSEKVVRTFLNRLETDGRIGQSSGQQKGQTQSVITICKYNDYQFGDTDEGNPSDQQKGNASDNQKATKGPEYEEGIRKKKKSNARERAGEPSGFENWYATYPRKKAPKDAARAYAKAITSGEITEAALLARTEAFAASWSGKTKEQRQFIPYPASWLNAGSYADEPEGQSESLAPAARDPATFTAIDWQRRLDHHRRTGEWGQHWGPKLGEADCLVPVELLQERIAHHDPPNFSGASK
jgi:hypothetical protein